MKRTGGAARRGEVAVAIALAGALFALPIVHGAAKAGTLSLVVLASDGMPLPGAVIMAEPQSQTLPPAAPLQAVVDQVDLAFVPDVMVVPTGSSVSFPNSDQVSHQVYSFSPARRFQLPLYRGKAYPPVTFDQPGIVTLGCNIHDNMLAYVVVTDAPFFGRTTEKGEWVARDVPDGAYRIRIWHPRLKDPAVLVDRKVQLPAEQDGITLTLDQPLRPPRLKAHPHSWDY
jgi:plastocyanin